MSFRYGKTLSNAIAVASFLAERWSDRGRANSAEVASARRISQPLAARLLVQLSQAGIVVGTTGPHGGYALAKAPSEIRLSEIASHFQDAVGMEDRCAYGPGYCGTGNPCPLHDTLVRLNQSFNEFLEETTLEVFRTVGSGAGQLS